MLEYVAAWEPADLTKSAKVRCDAPARTFTRRTFDSPNEPLTVVLVSDGGRQIRCAVLTPWPITKSLWQVGGDPLR